jgi:hypothetical protein
MWFVSKYIYIWHCALTQDIVMAAYMDRLSAVPLKALKEVSRWRATDKCV